MEKRWKTYGTLFASTFYLSAFTFGGGYVIVPLMKKKFVDELGWLEETEMLNLIAIAQSAPGPVAVNASILAGWRLLGLGGALAATLGTVLPPLIVLSAVSLFYSAFRGSSVANAVIKGMTAGVAAVIADVVITMAGRIIKEKRPLPIAFMAGAFLAATVFAVNVVYVIVACAALGVAVTIYDDKAGTRHL